MFLLECMVGLMVALLASLFWLSLPEMENGLRY